VAIALDAQGPSNTLATGCVAAANAIGEAARIIARGEADMMLAGGTDARVSPLAMLRYRDLGWLATRDDIDPTEVSAPFDMSAGGFVNAEGAGVIVLESREHARRRGARIRAELVGYGGANDGHALMQPQPEGRGLQRAIALCFDRARLEAGNVDVVFAPATSVPAVDRATARAFERTFGGSSTRTTVTATRSIVGHTHAASSALDCVAAISAIGESQVPATINVRRPITDLRLASGADTRSVHTALVCAYGFGGHAAALAWRRYAA
jgi:3-oxoacyl-[acyl-carrier-protein] synthase II